MKNRLDDFVKPGSKEAELVARIDFSLLPQHVAFIMDGNGRWAKKHLRPRLEGHRAGSKSVREAVETSAHLGIPYLSLYAFSKENWKRPKSEVDTLWRLLEDYLKKEWKVLSQNNFRLLVIGQKDAIPSFVRDELDRVEELTRNNDRMTILLALNYGGRSEIVDAAKKAWRELGSGMESLDEEAFSHYLYTDGIPDPDLLIRTSGEIRVSNFLLWQIAYAEIWITKTYWPDFRKRHFFQAIIDYQNRERRFGDIGEESR
ncbi:MAG: isoprenyl transferase [Candidatus Aminicenantes bacterium]|nr:isoprenyl transferase [Candidatus Aminicenantes bacterium]